MEDKIVLDTRGNQIWDFILLLNDEYQSHITKHRRTKSFKVIAADYLELNGRRCLTKSDVRNLFAKTGKIKKSTKKSDRFHADKFVKEIQWVFNFHK